MTRSREAITVVSLTQPLAALKRRWTDADLDARVELLQACLAAGQLSPARVRLAAFLGVESAAFAVDCERAGGPPVPVIAVEEILCGSWRDQAVRVRLAVAAARAVAPGWVAAYPGDPTVPAALAELEAFVCGRRPAPPDSRPVHEAVRAHRLAEVRDSGLPQPAIRADAPC